MSHEIEIQIIAALVAAGCAIPGMFLTLGGKAMITDSVSHSILPGIAAGFLIAGSVSSPLLIAGAFVAAFASAFSSETLSQSRLMSSDSAIAFIYPFFFSTGVILISRYAGNAHLDTDFVLLGEIALAPLDRVTAGGTDIGPFSLYSSGAIVLLNGIFAALFYKELKFSIFDPASAKSAGLSNPALSLCFSAIVCITCVVSFNSVGSVLLIALVATPPCCALLLTDKLGKAMAINLITAIAAAIAGFHAAVQWNTNIAGAITVVLGTVFFMLLIFAPQRGILSRVIENRRREKEFATALVLEQMASGGGTEKIETIRCAMRDKKSAGDALARAERKGYLRTDGRTVSLTRSGQIAAENFVSRLRT